MAFALIALEMIWGGAVVFWLYRAVRARLRHEPRSSQVALEAIGVLLSFLLAFGARGIQLAVGEDAGLAVWIAAILLLAWAAWRRTSRASSPFGTR